MTNDKMREEFEAWVSGKWPETELGQFNDGEYCGFTLQHCWAAWQASRAAVVVELPPAPEVPEDPEEAIDDSHMDAYHSAVRMRKGCAKSVEAAGLQVKP